MRKVGKCLKITDPETCRLAEELAKLTGEDIEDRSQQQFESD